MSDSHEEKAPVEAEASSPVTDKRIEFIVLGLLAVLILVLATPLTGSIKAPSVGPNPERQSFEP